MSTQNPNIKFLTVAEFKTQVGANKFSIVQNPKTNKLFAQGDNGANYRCKGALDVNLPISVLVESGDYANACFVNGSNANVLTTI